MVPAGQKSCPYFIGHTPCSLATSPSSQALPPGPHRVIDVLLAQLLRHIGHSGHSLTQLWGQC